MARDHPGAAQHREAQQLPHGALPCRLPLCRLADSDNGRPAFGSDPDAARPVPAIVGFTRASLLSRPPPGLRRDRALTVDLDALSVVHVGQAALLATRSGTLVPVTAGPAGLVPGGLDVPDQVALARFSPAGPARRPTSGGASICGRGTPPRPRSSCASRRPTRGSPRRSSPSSIAASRPAAGGFAAARRAAGLARGALEAPPGELDACVAATVGAGLGTTPAGDDVICGVLAGLDLLGHAGAHGRLGAAVTPLLAAPPAVAAPAGSRDHRPLHRGLIALAAALASASAPRCMPRWAPARPGAPPRPRSRPGFAAAIRAGALVGAGAR